MGNLQSWAGPLPKSWIIEQFEMTKKILNRCRELGMTPILPSFSGVVPPEMKSLFPDTSTVFFLFSTAKKNPE